MQENVVVLLHDRKVNKMEKYFEVVDKMENLKQGIMSGIINDEDEILEELNDCKKSLMNAMRFVPKHQIYSPQSAFDNGIPNPDDCKEFEVQKDAGPLEFTIDLMRSGDYKERFKAEYHQTKIRYDKLHKMLIKAEAGTLDFKPTCPLEMLKEQMHLMGMYLHTLEVRAEIEGIEL